MRRLSALFALAAAASGCAGLPSGPFKEQGRAYMDSNQWRQSYEAYTKAIEADTAYLAYHNLREEVYQASLDLADLYFTRADILHVRLSKLDQAIQDEENALRLYTDICRRKISLRSTDDLSGPCGRASDAKEELAQMKGEAGR